MTNTEKLASALNLQDLADAASRMDAGSSSYIPFLGGAVDSVKNPHPYRVPGVDTGETLSGFFGGISGGTFGGGAGLLLRALVGNKGKSLSYLNSGVLGGLLGSSLGTAGAASHNRTDAPLTQKSLLQFELNKAKNKMNNTEKLASASMLLVKQALMKKILTGAKDLGTGLLQGGKAGFKDLANLPMTGLKGKASPILTPGSATQAVGQGLGHGGAFGGGVGALAASPIVAYDSGKSNGTQEGREQGVRAMLEALKKHKQQKTEQGYGSRLLDALLNKGY